MKLICPDQHTSPGRNKRMRSRPELNIILEPNQFQLRQDEITPTNLQKVD